MHPDFCPSEKWMPQGVRRRPVLAVPGFHAVLFDGVGKIAQGPDMAIFGGIFDGAPGAISGRRQGPAISGYPEKSGLWRITKSVASLDDIRPGQLGGGVAKFPLNGLNFLTSLVASWPQR